MSALTAARVPSPAGAQPTDGAPSAASYAVATPFAAPLTRVAPPHSARRAGPAASDTHVPLGASPPVAAGETVMPLQRMLAAMGAPAAADPPSGEAIRPGPAAGAAAPSGGGFTEVHVQRQAETSQAPSTEVVPPAETAPPGAASAAAPGAVSDGDLDELARRLYEPLSARLRSELWLDRERAGHLIELRR